MWVGVGWDYDPAKNFPTGKCTNVTFETLAVKQNLFDLSLKTL